LEQARAGARLWLDWRASGPVNGLKLPLYQPGPRPPKKHRPRGADTPKAEYFRARFEAALAAIEPVPRAVVVHVCLCDEPPLAWSAAVGLGREHPVELLRTGLLALERYYGVARVSAPRSAAAAA
jgi:hypothetical protein